MTLSDRKLKVREFVEVSVMLYAHELDISIIKYYLGIRNRSARGVQFVSEIERKRKRFPYSKTCLSLFNCNAGGFATFHNCGQNMNAPQYNENQAVDEIVGMENRHQRPRWI